MGYYPYPQHAPSEAAAGIPGGDKPYLTAGERSVTRGRQRIHVSSPKGANSILGRAEGGSPVHYPLLPTFAPFGDAHTGRASHPQVTLASLAHQRLSMVGPLRGPPAGQNQTRYCSGLYPQVMRLRHSLPAPRTFATQNQTNFCSGLTGTSSGKLPDVFHPFLRIRERTGARPTQEPHYQHLSSYLTRRANLPDPACRVT